MVAVAMLLVWAGYGTGLFGWALFEDYDVTLGQLMSPLHPYSGPWPPAKIPPGQTWPGKNTPGPGGGTAGAKSTGGSGGVLGTIKKGIGGILTGGI